MTQRTVPALFITLAIGAAGGIGHAQTTVITDRTAPVASRNYNQVPVARVSNSSGVIVAPGGPSQIRASGGNVTVVQGGTPRPGYVLPYNSYPAYPAYAPSYNNYPSYPAYPNYGTSNYGTSTYGASVSVSTPGFQDNNFRLFPYATTVTTWGSNSGYNNGYNCAPQYPRYNGYPAYPTYIPGSEINGYRGAASGDASNYNYHSHSMVNGSYVGPNGMLVTPPYATGSVRR